MMGGRSERVNSAQNQLCGRGGVAGAAAMTSQQLCVGTTGRRLPLGLENGLRFFDDKRRGRHGKKNKELRARIEALEKKEGEGVQGGQGLPSRRERAAWRKNGEWTRTWRMRSRVAKSWMTKEKELRDIEKFSCVPKEDQENLKSNLQQQL